eukprot:11332781-Alexandrium_andersonii.AAC.1
MLRSSLLRDSPWSSSSCLTFSGGVEHRAMETKRGVAKRQAFQLRKVDAPCRIQPCAPPAQTRLCRPRVAGWI